MAQQEGRNRVIVEFHLTPAEQMHVFAQWREVNPGVPLDTMNSRGYFNALREYLAAHGWAAVTRKIPDEVEIKKIDYKAILKGVLPF